MALTNYELWTFRDAVEMLLDGVVGGDSSPRNLRSAIRAVLEAYSHIATVRQWHYYNRRLKLTTDAPYSTGTVAYDHTGGVYERMLTLTTGTWPSYAADCEIVIDSVRYEVEDRKSSSIITLTERANPGADVASGTTYSLIRDTYPLPDDFSALTSQLFDVLSQMELDYTEDVGNVLLATRVFGSAQRPLGYCITKSLKHPGALAVRLSPPPESARTYDANYRARPRALNTQEYCSGTITTAANSAAIVGTDTAFTQAHVGCVMRISANANQKPTTVVGSLLDNYTNPFVYQRIIKSVTDATNLTLDIAVDATYSGVRYTISDPIDLEAGAMMTYFRRLAEAHFARIEGRDDARFKTALAEQAFNEAAWADIRQTVMPVEDCGPETLADIAGEVDGTP